MKKIIKRILTSVIFVGAFVSFFAFSGDVFAQVCGGLPKGFIDYAVCTTQKSISCRCNAGGSIEITTCDPFSSCPADRPNRCIGSLYGSCLKPTPTPNSLVLVAGYVKDIFNRGVAGAKVTVNKVDNTYGPCLGTHFGCGTVTTDWSGKWTVGCTLDAKTKSLRIMETNAYGYKDSTRFPDASGGSVWDVNTVCMNPVIGGQIVQNVNFYDLKY